jgi:hypothetical protein
LTVSGNGSWDSARPLYLSLIPVLSFIEDELESRFLNLESLPTFFNGGRGTPFRVCHGSRELKMSGNKCTGTHEISQGTRNSYQIYEGMRKIATPGNPRIGMTSPTETLTVSGNLTVSSLPTTGAGTISFVCIDQNGRIFKKSTVCA